MNDLEKNQKQKTDFNKVIYKAVTAICLKSKTILSSGECEIITELKNSKFIINGIKETPENLPKNILYSILTSFGKEKTIYTIFSEELPPFENFLSTKERGFALPQRNALPQINTIEQCLYVGSSQDIYERLKQHLGISKSKTTSSLHLKHWWDFFKVKIFVYKFAPTISSKDLQTFEDLLWDMYCPIFGKKGPKATRQKNIQNLNNK